MNPFKVLEPESKLEISHPRMIAGRFKYLENESREHFVIGTLDTKLRIIRTHVISIGNINEALVHPREVFRAAIADGAYAIIVAHNHPTGSLVPSTQDRKVTQRLIEAGKLLGISVLDSIILGKNGAWTSIGGAA